MPEHISYSNHSVIEGLRATRLAKGWSQQELGARVGLPQSHISKIEAGRTDPKLSSLVELARALSLEIKFVPRTALPAIDSLVDVATSEPDNISTQRALAKIWSAQQGASHLAEIEPIRPELSQLRKSLAALEKHRFTHPDLAALSKALEPLNLVRKRFAQLDLAADRLGGLAGAFASPLNASTRSLEDLRERLTNSRAAESAKPRPAYKLDDDGDE